jgi:hypothetical protein
LFNVLGKVNLLVVVAWQRRGLQLPEEQRQATRSSGEKEDTVRR